MSRIYFHSPSETLEISGRERAWMGILCNDLAGGVLYSTFNCLDLAPFVPVGEFPLAALKEEVGSAIRFRNSLDLWRRRGTWQVEGQEYPAWVLDLNTCLVVGNDAVKLCARLHGQCEIHCYVEGRNRRWLAEIIRQGARSNIMRDDRGEWTRLANWLESRSDEPVVCSYSVCEQFPNSTVAGWVEEDADNPRWYALSPERRWFLAMTELQKTLLELTPEGWQDYRLDGGHDAFWLLEKAQEVRKTREGKT